MDKIQSLTNNSLRNDFPEFGPGDNIDVHVRVIEGDKTRVQIFSGTVVQRKGSGVSETFTVRKVSMGIGVERIFPMNSPIIAKITKNYSNKVRRSRLYYLRKLRGKASRLKRLYN